MGQDAHKRIVCQSDLLAQKKNKKKHRRAISFGDAYAIGDWFLG
jgi:hypothetical protein